MFWVRFNNMLSIGEVREFWSMNITEFKLVQPSIKPYPICVTEGGITILVKFVH